MKMIRRTSMKVSIIAICLMLLQCTSSVASSNSPASSLSPPSSASAAGVTAGGLPPVLSPPIQQQPSPTSTSSTTMDNSTPNCSSVAHLFESRGIKLSDIPTKPVNEMAMRYCEVPSGGACCTFAMETKLAMSSRVQLEKNSKELINKLSTGLAGKGTQFNDMFNQLLANSRMEFHSMFKKTYGVIYEQNSYVFSELFTELEKYYARGKVDLAVAMDSFFNTLYQKMFTVLNSQYTFDEKYLGCVSEHMKELKPFGDVPDKLSVQIKRSFVATRTYAQALITAADVAKKMTNIRLNPDCTAALTKMQQCNTCRGYAEKPCENYCINVMKGCLHYFHDLDAEWENFVVAMEKVAERLLGSFNIVMVVEPINIKISEAIMNFQEAGQDISNQVFQGCGRPVLGRGKRTINPKFKESNNRGVNRVANLMGTDAEDILDIDATLDDEIILKDTSRVMKRAADPDPEPAKDRSYERSRYDAGSEKPRQSANGSTRRRKKPQGRKNDDDDYPSREPLLDRVIKEIRQRVKESKKFWSSLPDQICRDQISSGTSDAPCWNGRNVDGYMHSVVGNYGTNPEFPGNPATIRQTSAVASQLYHLKTATNHLRNAYNGLDVNWSDQEDPFDGSGDGSGAGPDDEDGDDDEGSGLSRPFEGHKPIVPEHTDHPTVRDNGIGTNSHDDDDDTTSVIHNTSGPKYTSSETDENEYDEQDSTNKPKSSSDSSSRLKGGMTLRRALFMYLVPLYMAWFGGIVSDML